MKLSEKQKEALNLMRNDYELHKDRFGDALFYLRKDNAMTIFIHKGTGRSLLNKKIIEFKERASTQSSIYQLTELGKTIQL